MRQNLGTAALLLGLLATPAWPEAIRVTGRIEPVGAPGVRVELHSYIDKEWVIAKVEAGPSSWREPSGR